MKNNRIYVNEVFPKGFGFINLIDLTPNTNFATFDKLYSRQVLDFVIIEIKSEFPLYNDIDKLKKAA